MNPIPVFDLRRTIESVGDEVENRWRSLLRASSFIGGDEVGSFEASFARFLDSAACVGVANGTDALIVALRALHLRPGDEVIVPSFTFIATAGAVAIAGGTPVFADVEPDTLNLDWARAGERITDRTVGLIGVHLYGRPFAVDQARALAVDEDPAAAVDREPSPSGTGSGCSRTRPRPTARNGEAHGSATSAPWQPGASIRRRTWGALAMAAPSPATISTCWPGSGDWPIMVGCSITSTRRSA